MPAECALSLVVSTGSVGSRGRGRTLIHAGQAVGACGHPQQRLHLLRDRHRRLKLRPPACARRPRSPTHMPSWLAHVSGRLTNVPGRVTHIPGQFSSRGRCLVAVACRVAVRCTFPRVCRNLSHRQTVVRDRTCRPERHKQRYREITSCPGGGCSGSLCVANLPRTFKRIHRFAGHLTKYSFRSVCEIWPGSQRMQ